MVPLPAMVAALTMEEYGHTLSNFPPFYCGPANSDLFFYSVVLLNDIYITIGIPMLIIAAWSLHKVEFNWEWSNILIWLDTT